MGRGRRDPESPSARGRSRIPEIKRHQKAVQTNMRGLRGATPSMSSSAWEDDMRAKALVSTEWLAERLDSEKLCILDVRGEVGKKDLGNGQVVTSYEALRGDFVDAHIPGAAFVDWTRDITDASSDVPVQLASLDKFASAMEEKGVGTDKTVVCYDNGNMLFATRVWWALTRYGHRKSSVSFFPHGIPFSLFLTPPAPKKHKKVARRLRFGLLFPLIIIINISSSSSSSSFFLPPSSFFFLLSSPFSSLAHINTRETERLKKKRWEEREKMEKK